MAYALINQERGLYSARGVRPETVWCQWEITDKIQETTTPPPSSELTIAW